MADRPAGLAIEQTLSLDIRSVHQGRGQAVEKAGGQEYACRLDALEIHFTTFATHVLVTSCTPYAPPRSGYLGGGTRAEG